MELQLIEKNELTINHEGVSTDIPFILANTIAMQLLEIERQHIIPVFVKDNETVISHQDFIGCVYEVVQHIFRGETILRPSIRVSHPIKGRIPEAKDKPAKELLEHEKTIYYERMAFVIEIPSITSTIGGNKLSLTVGGVKSYNLDNLYNRKGANEHFKVFIGFQNKVCCNLCVWSDGYSSNLIAKNSNDLMKQVYELFSSYNHINHFSQLQKLEEYYLTEHQFATLIGRAKLYQYLPALEKKRIPNLLIGDNQIGIIAKDYYQDNDFSRTEDGSINLWNTYNLFTGANKHSYIDTFLDRGENAFVFVKGLEDAISKKEKNWFLS